MTNGEIVEQRISLQVATQCRKALHNMFLLSAAIIIIIIIIIIK